jgi:hypothetical protein
MIKLPLPDSAAKIIKLFKQKNEREKYSLLRDEKKVIHATLPAAETNIQHFSKKTCR